MRKPKFTHSDIKYSEDAQTYERALGLYNGGKVSQIQEDDRGYFAIVEGTKSYHVAVSARRVYEGDCDCYLGQNDVLCKHILALALVVLDKTVGLEERAAPSDMEEVKTFVNTGLKKIKAYTGPSRTWFTYQRSLSTGAGVISDSIQNLSANKGNADYLWSLILRLSKKLATGGVDDSDGVVGECVDRAVEKLAEMAREQSELKDHMLKTYTDDTGFGFEDDLWQSLVNI